MKKIVKKVIEIIVCIIMIPILLAVNLIFYMAINKGISTLCAKKVSDFTVEEHADRIRERLDRKIPELEAIFDFNVDSYELLPVLSENNELSYYIAEFEPLGFLVIMLLDEKGDCDSVIPRSMYYHYDVVLEWSPYYYDSNNKNEECYYYDEFGEKIVYHHSPFYVNQTQSKKNYIFNYSGISYVFCTNIDGYLINQITGVKIGFENGRKQLKGQSTIEIDCNWSNFLY